jgi:hypothetical protein
MAGTARRVPVVAPVFWGLVVAALLVAAFGLGRGLRPAPAESSEPAAEAKPPRPATRPVPHLVFEPEWGTAGRADRPGESPAASAAKARPPHHGPGESPAQRAPLEPEEAPPLAPETLVRQQHLRQMVETAAARHPGVSVAFSDCSGAHCLARVVAADPAAIDAFAAAAHTDLGLPPGTEVRVRERLTATQGRLYEVDVPAAAQDL